jgi:hypothetical protein
MARPLELCAKSYAYFGEASSRATSFGLGQVKGMLGSSRRDVLGVNNTCTPAGNPNHKLNSDK